MLLKKLISTCLLPFPIGLALVLGGLALLWLTQRQRLGRVAVAAGVVVLLLAGYGTVPGLLIDPLERRYAALTPAAVAALSPAPEAIVVLGSGFHADPSLPPNDELDAIALARLVEGVRLARLLPRARLVLSGGLGQAEALAETAAFLGVARERLVLENGSVDTADEAVLLRPLVGAAPFLLVTSAAHMSRSMALCRKQALRPIGAPAGFIGTEGGGGWSLVNLVPRAEAFVLADHAIHEWIGLVWSHLRGTI
jgi:uncharacterized SAM-binding protein YcdF (DUF218 family)